MEQVENKVCKEGDHVEVYCNVTAGIPDPAILWTNVTSGEHIEGNPLSITNITRAQAGEYRCTVNNTCGVDSIVVAIDVQCKNIDFFTSKFLCVKFNAKPKCADQSTGNVYEGDRYIWLCI